MTTFYMIDEEGQITTTADVIEWARWYEDADKIGLRQVALTEVDEITRVSTVFLGLDHNFAPASRPDLFETRVFGGAHSHRCVRVATREAALLAHEFVLQMLAAEHN